MVGRRVNRAVIVIACALVSCGKHQMEFDKSKWNKSFDGVYEYRERMVNDLMENHIVEGMSYAQLVDLMGQPENYGNVKPNTIGYEIMVDYGWNIDPVEGKTLFLELSQDSMVVDYKLDHWNR